MTPTKLEFMKVPTNPLIVPVKLLVPVKNANAVASIFLGVILANSIINGSKTKHDESVSLTTSVKIITNISLKPYSSFLRKTKSKFIGANAKLTKMLYKQSVRNSFLLNRVWYKDEPTKRLAYPSTPSNATVNLDSYTMSSMK